MFVYFATTNVQNRQETINQYFICEAFFSLVLPIPGKIELADATGFVEV